MQNPSLALSFDALAKPYSPASSCPYAFEPFGSLTAEQEFDLLAPVVVYFLADLGYRAKARAGMTALKKQGYALFEEDSVANYLASTSTPDGIVNRYNMLMNQLVRTQEPQARPFRDEWGAFGFQVKDDPTMLSGDIAGCFALYLTARLVRARVAQSCGAGQLLAA